MTTCGQHHERAVDLLGNLDTLTPPPQTGVHLGSSSFPKGISMYSRLRLGLLACLLFLGASLFATPVASAFSDVAHDQDYPQAVTALTDLGVLSGFPDGTFHPQGPVTRQQFAKMIVKTLGLPVTGNESSPFIDLPRGLDAGDPFYPDKYIAECGKEDITEGKTPTAFAPYANITRAQLLSMIVRATPGMGLLTEPTAAYYQGTSAGTHFLRTFTDPTHALNAQTAEFNGLLAGILADDSSGTRWDPYRKATRGEVAQILWRLWQKIGSPPMGPDVRIGFVSPMTGSLAVFGITDRYCLQRWREAIASGLIMKDGKKHRVSIILADSQSDPSRAAQVAGDLIMTAKVDLMMVGSTPETVNPVADQCEAMGVPCISTDTPWENYFFGRGGTPETPFTWTYHFYWGAEDLPATLLSVWEQLPTNKTVGFLWSNDSNGFTQQSVWDTHPLPDAYRSVVPPPYLLGTEDFTSIVAAFRRGGIHIISGTAIPPDFINFWKQCKQQGLNPKIVTMSRALIFPQVIDAMGDIGLGLTTEVSWSPAFPFVSSLTGEACAQLAADFELRTGQEWTQVLQHYALGEMALDTLKRAGNLTDPRSIVEALKTTNMETIAGPVDFTSPVARDSLHPVANVHKSPLAIGQWVRGQKWRFDLTIVGNEAAPMVPVQSELQPLQ
jgi:branched-chain amino acid transport system substrate-binding protein